MQSVLLQPGWLWCHHAMAVTHDGRPASNAAACTQPGGGAVGRPSPEVWDTLGCRMRLKSIKVFKILLACG